MAKGSVFFHSDFLFHDGEKGKKLFVILNEPQNNEPYLVIKTTSQLHNKQFQNGCNERFGVFFIPAGTDKNFPLSTLLQLIEIYEFSAEEFLKGSLQEKVITPIGDLGAPLLAQVINCIRKLKEDISEKHFKLITR